MSSIPKYSPIWLLERQSFRFQKITKNLKMNIFCRNFANFSFFFEEESPKRKLKIKFVLNLLSGKTVFNLVKGKTIFCSFSFKHDFLCFGIRDFTKYGPTRWVSIFSLSKITPPYLLGTICIFKLIEGPQGSGLPNDRYEWIELTNLTASSSTPLVRGLLENVKKYCWIKRYNHLPILVPVAYV